MVFAGPATYWIFAPQIVRFVVLAGPATDDILELQIAWFVGPVHDRKSVLFVAGWAWQEVSPALVLAQDR